MQTSLGDYFKGYRDGKRAMKDYYNMTINGILDQIEDDELLAREEKDKEREMQLHDLWSEIKNIKRELDEFENI